jgi:RND family efflux transporter MFP subunit
MGRQQIAQQDLKLITTDSLFKDSPLSAEERQLILRQPQLDAVNATIVGAKASVDQAQLNLERTTIRAPFDAHILSQNVTTGSQVGPGDDLGRLVGTEYYWVTAAIPVSKLQWLRFPENDRASGSKVLVRNSTAWPEGQYREGYLDKQIGALDGQTRLARVLVKVTDPLAKNTDLEDRPKLMIGSFVEVDILADKLDGVVRLSRDHIRSNETVWVMKENKLEIREVDIVLTDNEYAYIRKGLNEGDHVVITDLSTVSNGIGLRTRTEGSENEPTQ